MITEDRMAKVRAIEAKPARMWTDEDIHELASAYEYSVGIQGVAAMWERILMAQRHADQRELDVKSLEDRVRKLEVKIKN